MSHYSTRGVCDAAFIKYVILISKLNVLFWDHSVIPHRRLQSGSHISQASATTETPTAYFAEKCSCFVFFFLGELKQHSLFFPFKGQCCESFTYNWPRVEASWLVLTFVTPLAVTFSSQDMIITLRNRTSRKFWCDTLPLHHLRIRNAMRTVTSATLRRKNVVSYSTSMFCRTCRKRHPTCPIRITSAIKKVNILFSWYRMVMTKCIFFLWDVIYWQQKLLLSSNIIWRVGLRKILRLKSGLASHLRRR